MAEKRTKATGLFRSYPHLVVSMVAIVVVALYWFFVASDRYVSESNVVLESPQIALPEVSFGSLFGGAGGNASGDMLLLRDHLLSVDMMRGVDNAVDIRTHYSSPEIDYLSRLRDPAAPLEEFYEYYRSIVSVELDDYARVLRIKVRAFTPEIAYQICSYLISAGEAYMNKLGQRLAEEQVRFLEKQVEELTQKYDAAKRMLIDYQNEYGMVSPAGTVESISALVAELESQLVGLKARRAVLISFQSASSPDVKRVDIEISALQDQISFERRRMAEGSGNALNVKSSEYQTLELKLQFAQESYSGALAALQNTRIEAARQLKQVSVLQSPTLPEYAVEPRRVYYTVVFAIVAIFLALIAHMLILIIKDHRD